MSRGVPVNFSAACMQAAIRAAGRVIIITTIILIITMVKQMMLTIIIIIIIIIIAMIVTITIKIVKRQSARLAVREAVVESPELPTVLGGRVVLNTFVSKTTI